MKIPDRIYFAQTLLKNFVQSEIDATKHLWDESQNSIFVGNKIGSLTVKSFSLSSFLVNQEGQCILVGVVKVGDGLSESYIAVLELANEEDKFKVEKTTLYPLGMQTPFPPLLFKNNEMLGLGFDCYMAWGQEAEYSIYTLSIQSLPSPLLMKPNTSNTETPVSNITCRIGTSGGTGETPWMRTSGKVVSAGVTSNDGELYLANKPYVSAVSTPYGGLYMVWKSKKNELAFCALPKVEYVEASKPNVNNNSVLVDPASFESSYINSNDYNRPFLFDSIYTESYNWEKILPQPNGKLYGLPLIAATDVGINASQKDKAAEIYNFERELGILYEFPVILVPLADTSTLNRKIAITAYIPTLNSSGPQGFIPWSYFYVDMDSRNFEFKSEGSYCLLSYETTGPNAGQKTIKHHEIIFNYKRIESPSPDNQLRYNFNIKDFSTHVIGINDSWSTSCYTSKLDSKVYARFMYSSLIRNDENVSQIQVSTKEFNTLNPVNREQLYVGQLLLVANPNEFDVTPGYLLCDGSMHKSDAYPALSAMLKPNFGGDNIHFYVPKINPIVKGVAYYILADSKQNMGNYGGILGQITFTLNESSVLLKSWTEAKGDSYPIDSQKFASLFKLTGYTFGGSKKAGKANLPFVEHLMSESPKKSFPIESLVEYTNDEVNSTHAYLGSIVLCCTNNPPKGFWAKCDGRILKKENTDDFFPLYKLIGTYFDPTNKEEDPKKRLHRFMLPNIPSPQKGLDYFICYVSNVIG